MDSDVTIYRTPFTLFYLDSVAYGFVPEGTPIETVKSVWDEATATKTENSYLFKLLYPFCIRQGETITIPTGFGIKSNSADTSWHLKNGLRFSFNGKTEIKNTPMDINHILISVKAKENTSLRCGTEFLELQFI